MKRTTKLFLFSLFSLVLLVSLIQTVQAILPSTVGTSTVADAVSLPFQRKSFYANGLFWVFYSNGSYMVYRTSTDGSTWSSATTVRACTNGYYFSIWFDGTYLHYAYATATSIYYRRGTPNSDGTITWSAAEQTVSTTFNKANYPMISVDSNGYVWIGYRDFTGTYYCPYVIKSGNNDGTWGTTPTGFPYQLSTTSNSNWKVSIVPLTSGKMLAVYAYDGATVKAKRWDGSAWGSEVATTSATIGGCCHSAVAQGDDVHLTFLKSTGYDILYVKYTYSSNSFGTETTLQADASQYSVPVLSIDTATNGLYVFAATKTTNTPSGWTANHIYYKKYTASSGTWGSWIDWIDESTEALYYAYTLTCFYQSYGSKVGLEYVTKTQSPFNVKFESLISYFPDWRYVEDWYGNIIGKTYYFVEQWFGSIVGWTWSLVEIWNGILHTKGWSFVETWSGMFPELPMFFVRSVMLYVGLGGLFSFMPLLGYAGKKRNLHLLFAAFILLFMSWALLYTVSVTSNF